MLLGELRSFLYAPICESVALEYPSKCVVARAETRPIQNFPVNSGLGSLIPIQIRPTVYSGPGVHYSIRVSELRARFTQKNYPELHQTRTSLRACKSKQV
jgi:hypothetical protein